MWLKWRAAPPCMPWRQPNVHPPGCLHSLALWLWVRYMLQG